MSLFRLYWEVLGPHTHVRVFAGKGSLTLTMTGHLTFRNEEWEDFMQELNRLPGSSIEILREDDDES